MLAAHLGIIDEDAINNMSYVFFESVLEELGYKLNFEAVAHYAGNSFCEKSWDMIQKSNPFNLQPHEAAAQAMTSLAGFFGRSKITIAGGNANG